MSNAPVKRAQTGFTLVELVVALVVATVVAGFMTMFMTAPVQAWLAQGRRSNLAQQAQLAQQHLQRDLAAALPNSVRYAQSGSVLVIEAWPILTAARYRDSGSLGAGHAIHELDFSAADNQFAVFAPFAAITYPFVSTQHHLVINHLGTPGADVYELANVITPAGESIRIDDSTVSFTPLLPSGEAHITLGSGFHFAAPAAQQMIYLVGQPVRYRCDASDGTLRRYSGYAVTSALGTAPPGGSSSDALISRDVQSCAIDCIPGSAQCSRTVSLHLVWSRDGESLNVLQQIALEHVP